MKYLNHLLPVEERVEDLISRMTIEEKISQLYNISTEIERLNIPRYDWRNEALQGVAFVDISTIFPQAIGMAATFNEKLIESVASAIGDEARARHHEYCRRDKRVRWTGITFSTPNINIVRDPRWGRCQETFGEDPYLTSRMGVAFCKGLQGSHPKYLKTSAEPKHFAVHSGPEKDRHRMDIHVSKKDLYETYLPAFKVCIQEANAQGIMSAYHRLYGVPCSASTYLLQEILRDEFGFDGYIISDGGAIRDIHKYHKVAEDYSEAAAMALKAGCDILNPMDIMTTVKLNRLKKSVLKAIKDGKLTEEVIDIALKRTLSVRFKLGMFDPPELVPYTKIPYDIINSKKHRELARKCAQETIVLLKNEKNILPLDINLIESIALIGPTANNLEAMYYPHYYTNPPEIITILEGLQKKIKNKIKINFAKGCELTRPADDWNQAIEFSQSSDVIIVVLVLTGNLEGEEGYVIGELTGDRTHLRIPKIQEKLLKELEQIDKPLILILSTGSAVATSQNSSAILEAWYSGCEGGNAIADVIFGDYNPAGRLPLTFYNSIKQLLDYRDYSMENRTYRYYKGEILYPFGYGLSYSNFLYENLQISQDIIREKDNVEIKVDVLNKGPYSGDEVVQVYLSRNDLPYRVPIHELKAFKRIHIKKDHKKQISFNLEPSRFKNVNEQGDLLLEPGIVEISIGGGQPIAGAENILTDKIEIS
jgi:beta-glucosidase